MKEIIKTDKAPKAVGPYSQGVKAGNFIFVSGQFGTDPASGELAGTTIQTQTSQAIQNIEMILLAAGASLSWVVKVTVVLTDESLFEGMNHIYKTYFGTDCPARFTSVGRLLKKGALVEIDAIAQA